MAHEAEEKSYKASNFLSNNPIIKDLQRWTERKGEITTKLIFLI